MLMRCRLFDRCPPNESNSTANLSAAAREQLSVASGKIPVGRLSACHFSCIPQAGGVRHGEHVIAHLPICLRPHAVGESIHADDSEFVKSSSDQFVPISRLELQRDDRPVTVNYAGSAGGLLARRSRRQMLDVNVCADSTLARLQAWKYCFSRRVFQEPDQLGRRKHGGHLLVSKVDSVLHLDHELNFSERANPGT